MKIGLIINPHSRRGDNKFKPLKEMLSKHELLYAEEVTDTSKLSGAIKKALSKDITHLFVGGGDGTVMCAAEILAQNQSDVVLCVLPLGTGNYFARNLKIGIKNVEQTAKKLLKSSKTKEVYLGVANDKYFSLMADIGISSEVSQNIDDSTKKKLGMLAYAAEVFRHASKHEPYKVRIKTKDDSYEFSTHELIIAKANLNEHIRLAPDISMHSDELLLLSYSQDNNLLSHMRALGAFMLTGDEKKSGVFAFRFRDMQIETMPSKTVSLDGEPLTKTPLKIKVDQRPISVAITD